MQHAYQQALLARQQSSLYASTPTFIVPETRLRRFKQELQAAKVVCTSVVDKAPVTSQSDQAPCNSTQSTASCQEGIGVTDGGGSLLRTPEQFFVPKGELSKVNKTASLASADVYRCAGCTVPECQGSTGCSQNQWRFSPTGYIKEVLTAKVYDVAVETPLEVAEKLSESLDTTLYLKREDLQPVFSFKLRGAYNKMANLSQEQLDRGVICSSAGNHAQGVALAASKLGCSATICMPTTTPDIKVSAVRRLGGNVQLVGESYQETQAYAQGCSVSDGRVFVAPYDDPYTIAGQGTIAAEIVRQLGPKLDKCHAVFVAVGGGGLIAGIAAYIKPIQPDIKIIGVEPTGANAMAQSLAEGQRVTLTRVDAFADGVAVKQVGAETFRLCREFVDGVMLVDNGAISAAIKDVFNETRNILEPAGAVAVAGAKAYCKARNMKDSVVVAVTSGANMNFDRLRLVSELADVGARREAMLTTTIPEVPGAFIRFVGAALSGTDIQVTECKYRYSAGSVAHVLFSVSINDDAQLTDLLSRMRRDGFETDDISCLEAAQVHLRHLVGGRARSYMGTVPHERIFQVEFPERPGALQQFLRAVSPTWNITLFHYRNTGNQFSTVLVGMQVAPTEQEKFQSAISCLNDFTFSELSDEARTVFQKFIA